MVRHLRAGLAMGLLVLFWGLCGFLLQRLGLERNHGPWDVELFDAIASAVVWTVGGVCYSILRARAGEPGLRAGVGPAAIAGAVAGGVAALTVVIKNVVWPNGLATAAVAERAGALVLFGALGGVIVLGAFRVLMAIFIPRMQASDR